MFFIIIKDMLLMIYIVLVMFICFICSEVIGFKSYYVIKINENLKFLCYKIVNIKSENICLGICRIKMNRIVMISYDRFIKMCICCNDIIGSDLIGLNWKFYVLCKCKYIF